MSFADIGRFIRNTRLSGAETEAAVRSVADRDAAEQVRLRRHRPAAGLCPFAA
ncbi:hypothetical protein SDC9_52149 [bioreactor metagenome]|uniref:Uncharacterized protein n=1 Tax=bioreactor metagenome TaxID=1076179 RepID=A0A644WUV9_9ZZZZ